MLVEIKCKELNQILKVRIALLPLWKVQYSNYPKEGDRVLPSDPLHSQCPDQAFTPHWCKDIHPISPSIEVNALCQV